MLEPPSKELQQRLRDWQLCQPGDLRRARRFVQQLARDLPAFDSVWIDALVRLGRLTPYQARVLESDAPEALCIEQHLLLEELGCSATGRTWLAKPVGQREFRILKRVQLRPERRAVIVEQGRQLIQRAVDFSHPHLVPPSLALETPEGLVFNSPYVRGVPLGELLIRRGRFPAILVAEIGKQLAAGLAAWHARGLAHGDLRLSHVRIDDHGAAVLVEAGIRPVIEPEITIHATLAQEAYDGIAPELIGVGSRPTRASDMYALGCLLWQLLAGRPPYAVADPLAKLAAHQTRRIEDIREWAPETPSELAELIHDLTEPQADQRLIQAAEVPVRLATLRLPGRAGVRRFRQRFELAVPHLRQQQTPAWISWPLVATTSAALAAGAVFLADNDRRQELLSVAQGWFEVKTAAARTSAADAEPLRELMPLPSPTADGTVWLTTVGPYSADALRFTGRLQVLGAEGVCPEILIRERPWDVACEELVLRNVIVRRDQFRSASPAGSEVLVRARAQRIEVADCLWDLGQPRPRGPQPPPPTGLVWELVEPLDRQAGQIRVTNSEFRGVGVALQAGEALRQATFQNVLRLGGESLVCWQGSTSPAPAQVSLDRVTLRDTRQFLGVQPSAGAETRLRLSTVDCVLALSGDDRSLIGWNSPQPPQLITGDLEWQGETTLVPANTELLIWRGAAADLPTVLPTDELSVEGLISGQCTFQGPPTFTLTDSVVIETDVPRRSAEQPGIDPQKFSPCRGGTPAASGPELTLEPIPAATP